MWNFHYLRMGADSDLYCMLMADFECGKGIPCALDLYMAAGLNLSGWPERLHPLHS